MRGRSRRSTRTGRWSRRGRSWVRTRRRKKEEERRKKEEDEEEEEEGEE